MFQKRLIGGALVVLISALVIWLGGITIKCVCLALSCIGAYEIYKAADIYTNPFTWITYPAIACYYIFIAGRIFTWIIIAVMFITMLLYLFLFRSRKLKPWIEWLSGLFVVGISISSLYELRVHDNGVFLLILAFVTAWVTDTAAYCFGMLLGKHHPFPVLSPKKTIEGCIGGIVMGTVAGIALAAIFNQPIVIYAIISFCASIISECGDLTFSAFKRSVGVKDYGNIIYGHGGILDRFDSLIFTGAFIFICINILL